MELRPFEFKTKIAVVHQAHLIDKTASNKLLKLLEEPTDDTVIFFLFGAQSHALKTIESRGINLQLPATTKDTSPPQSPSQYFEINSKCPFHKELAKYLFNGKQLSELLDYVHKKRESETIIIGAITSLYQNFSSKYHQAEKFRVELEKFEHHRALNMPIKTRIFPLIQMVKKDFAL